MPLSCYKKKLQNLSYLNCGLQFRQIWIQLLQSVGTIAKESVIQSTHYWSGRTETATENRVGQAGSCRYCASHSVASSIAPDHWCVFCTTSFAIFPKRGYQVKWIQFWRSWKPLQLRWYTLVRRGRKCLHNFAAKLFRKLCIKYHQNRPSFIGDITKTFWFLFPDTIYLHLGYIHSQNTLK